MPAFTPVQLASWTGGRWTDLPVSPLTGFAIDSRAVRPGELFVALKTDKRDGHGFLAAAQAAGAGAALVAVPDPALGLPQLVVGDPLAAFQTIAREHRRAFRGPVVGISGSAGKTSTKDLLALLLGGAASGVQWQYEPSPATEIVIQPDYQDLGRIRFYDRRRGKITVSYATLCLKFLIFAILQS